MKASKIFFGLGIFCILASCQNSSQGSMDEQKSSQNASTDYTSSIAATGDIKDTSRKFIRTAELKFRVKNVLNTTYDIEDITRKNDGFVTYTNLMCNQDYTQNTIVSKDSSLETIYFTVSNSILLRIPNTKLDETMKEIAKNVDFLDYRIIKAEDVSLQIISNKLTLKNSQKNGNKQDEKPIFDQYYDSKQNVQDAYISNLSLQDQINFSTIKVDIYERQTLKRTMLANEKNIDEYKPNFGRKILDSLHYGWNILETFIVFLFQFWGLFLFGFIVYFIIKKYKFWKKK